MNKTISQFTETTSPQNDDLFLLQRGVDGEYKSIKVQNLGGGIFKETYELSIAELEDLNTTPIEVLAAQGANTYIEIISANTFRDGAAFTAGDAQLKLVFTGQTQAHYQTDATYLTAVAASYMMRFFPVSGGLRMFANTGISAYLTQDVTTATGTVTIDIIYRVITIS